MKHAAHVSANCAFMVELVGLLGKPLPGRHRLQADVLAARLDQLEEKARQDGAPTTTIAAIIGARALLRLVEAPVVRLECLE